MIGSISSNQASFSSCAISMTSFRSDGSMMEQSRLRARTGMRYALLNPILEELASESKIKITVGKQGDLISLIVR